MQDKKINLMDLIPIHSVQSEISESGEVVVLIPKFSNPFLVRWLLPRLKSPNFRMQLDAYGSFVWNRCDGNKTVAKIAEEMAEKFNEDIQPLYKRTALFVQNLFREDAIIFTNASPKKSKNLL